MLAGQSLEPRNSLDVLLRQAALIKERRRAQNAAATLGLSSELDNIRSSLGARGSQVKTLARELAGSRHRESELAREVNALQEQLRHARTDGERTLRRAVQEGQRREVVLSESLAKASTERDSHRAELARARALLATRDGELASAQTQLRTLRTRLDEQELTLRQSAFVRANTPGSAATPATSSARRVRVASRDVAAHRALGSAPAGQAQRSSTRGFAEEEEEEDLASAQRAYIGKLLGGGT